MRWRECATPAPNVPVCRRGRNRRRNYYRRTVQLLEQIFENFRTPGGALLGAEQQLFLGEDFFPWMMVAIGGALVVGNLLAWFRPPAAAEGKKPPLSRTITMSVLGALAFGWGLITILAA